MSDSRNGVKCELDGIEVHVWRSDDDGKLVIQIDGPQKEEDQFADGSPDIRVWLNEALIYEGE